MVNIHHIVSDGVSHGILIESFLSMYRGLELPDLKIQYKDYAEWQQRPAVKEEMKSQEKYWLQEFRGEIPVLFLPTDFPRPEIQDFSGNFVSFDLDREKAAQLTEISQSQEVTLFMLLLALFNVFLLKLSNQEDIITGTPIAGRRHADLEGVVGMFVNTLAVRCFPAGQKTFLTFLKEVKEKVLTIFENQDYQFEDLVENVLLERDMSRNPLFDVSFTLDNVFETSASGEAPPAGNRDLKTSPYPYDVTISKFDLALTAKETPVAMIFHFGYSSKLFKEETILRFSRYLKWIISMVIENPNREISGLEILSAEEKKQLLVDFNDTAAYYPKDKTIQQLFREEVEKKPGAAAVVEVEPGRLPFIVTNRELNERATWMARLLRQKDITPGTIVGIMMGRSVEMIIALLGILEVGGAYLPLDPDYPGERLNYMLKDSSSNVLLTTGRLLAERKERKREEKPEHWQGEVILLDKMNWSAPPASQLSPRQQPITNPANFAYIIYTSGSTGRPRGVMVGHRNVVRLVKGTNYILFKQEDRLLLTGSIAFDITTFEIWAPLLNGIALYLADQNVIMEAEKFKKILDENQISVLHLIPQLFSQLAHQLPVIFERLRYFLVGGDLVKPYYVNKIRNLYPGVKILHMYGPTENTTFSTFMLVDRDYENTIPIGKPIGNSTGYIVDRYNKLAAVGVPGELLVGGDGVAAGYLNRPELTAEKFDYDFWDLSDYHDEQEPLGQDINVFGAGEVRQLRQLTQINKKFLRGSRGQFLQKVPPGRRRQKIYKTGDIVRWLPEGTIEFLGREDTQVKIKGIRIELGEIENQLLNHEEIKETVVIARANNSGEKFLCVYYTADREIPVSALREYLFGRLPDSMIPAYYIHMTKLPLTPNGKIDRKLLPLPGDTRPNLEITYAAPKSDLEQTFADIWQKSLNIDKVGLNDNFFELGGNSLSIVKVHSELKQRLENDIPLVALFRYPTIAALVAYINRGAKSIIRDDRIEESVNRMEETLQMLLGEENE